MSHLPRLFNLCGEGPSLLIFATSPIDCYVPAFWELILSCNTFFYPVTALIHQFCHLLSFLSHWLLCQSILELHFSCCVFFLQDNCFIFCMCSVWLEWIRQCTWELWCEKNSRSAFLWREHHQKTSIMGHWNCHLRDSCCLRWLHLNSLYFIKSIIMFGRVFIVLNCIEFNWSEDDIN